MNKSNCLLYAIGKFWRFGGYLIMRKTTRTRGWWPHFLYSKDLETFEELIPRPGVREKVLFPKIWFPGYERRWQGNERNKFHRP